VFRRASIPQFRMDPGAPYIAAVGDQIHPQRIPGLGPGEVVGSDIVRGALRQFIGSRRNRPPASAALLKTRAQGCCRSEVRATDIRYFGAELGVNTHRPTAPDKVLAQRFGDCKDKVLLLISLLRRLDIPASPVLVSTSFRGGIGELLPSPLAFDHVIMRVAMPGVFFWLDATRSHQTGTLAHRQSIRGWARGYGLGDTTATLTDLPSPTTNFACT